MLHRIEVSERRRFGRRACRAHGWIHVKHHSRIACVVTDVSEGGALLTHDPGMRLPSRFALEFDGLDARIDCEVRHGGDGTTGVEFVNRNWQSDAPPPPAIAELLDWLK